jgi:tetratricopeptide (TPR) repeat protein
MVELETPEIDDVDEDAPAYKRVVAVLVVLITLFGSGIAYLQARESNKEDAAARDAQRFAVEGLGAQVDASADFAADLRIGTELDVTLQREALNAGRVNNSQGDAEGDVHLAAQQRFAATRQAIAGQTPIDPSNPATVTEQFAAGNESPDAARLRQTVEADLANDHGGKADSFVAVLTVLAVALFLLGLSLTVQGRSRYVLATPGVIIALVCVAWSGLIDRREVTSVSNSAVRLTAEGLRLQQAGDVDGAIDAYDQALRESPGFATAYARRADARFVQGSDQVGQTTFISITSRDALRKALDDLDKALDLGNDTDIDTLASAGFFSFLDRDFDRAADLSRQALDLNDQLAQVWFNLGVAEVARDDETAAERAYRQGRHLLEDEPDAATRTSVLAGARTDLSVLRDLLSRRELGRVDDLIESTEADLAAFEAGFADLPCDDEPCPTADDVGRDAEIGDVTFTRSGATVFAGFDVDNVDPGTPVATAWYLRTDSDSPFQQAAISLDVNRVADDGTVSSATLPSFDPACPVPGDYLVRVYAGTRFLGEGEGTIDPGPLGSAFRSETDPIEGYDACVPEEFTTQRGDVTAIDSFTFFDGPDFAIGLNVTPGALIPGNDPDEIARSVLTGTLGVDESDLRPISFGARDVDGNFLFLDGLAGVAADGDSQIAFGIGPDGASRNITITGSGDPAVLDEAIALIEFTGLPSASP